MTIKTVKRFGKITVKLLAALILIGSFSLPFMDGSLDKIYNPLARKKVSDIDKYMTQTFTLDPIFSEQTTFTTNDLAANIKDYVTTPDGGVSWDIFAETKQIPYAYIDDEGDEWEGVKPEFSDPIKALDGADILIQGYMFPLSQEEGQTLFLLGPFPLSCPFHYHVTSNLVIEVHAADPQKFSYDPVNVTGRLELIPKDDEYNVFYRLHDATLVQ